MGIPGSAEGGDLGRPAPARLEGRGAVPDEDAQRLVHELQVHQLELEMQNEALRETRLEAEAGRRRYLDLYDFAPVGYFTLDAGGTLTEGNLAGARLLGEDRCRLAGQQLLRHVAEGDQASFGAFLQGLFEGGAGGAWEGEFRRADRRRMRLRLEASASVDGGGIRLVALDVTGQRMAEEQVLRLNQELECRVQQRTAQLEVANRDLEAFGYFVSHEMRAPIARMEGYGRMLRLEAPDPARLSHVAQRIEDSSRRMRAVIDSLLQLTRVSLLTVSREPVDLSALAREVLEELDQDGWSAAARVTVAPTVPARGDPRLLRALLRNLLQNALKFTSGVEAAGIAFGVAGSMEAPVCFVRDQGPGFDMDHAGRIFQPFARLPQPGGPCEGEGIGLAMARMIVEKHGGRIWAESSPGRGATFFFQLGS